MFLSCPIGLLDVTCLYYHPPGPWPQPVVDKCTVVEDQFFSPAATDVPHAQLFTAARNSRLAPVPQVVKCIVQSTSSFQQGGRRTANSSNMGRLWNLLCFS